MFTFTQKRLVLTVIKTNNGADFDESSTFIGLPSGFYTPVIKDSNLCTFTLEPVELKIASGKILIETKKIGLYFNSWCSVKCFPHNC